MHTLSAELCVSLEICRSVILPHSPRSTRISQDRLQAWVLAGQREMYAVDLYTLRIHHLGWGNGVLFPAQSFPMDFVILPTFSVPAAFESWRPRGSPTVSWIFSDIANHSLWICHTHLPSASTCSLLSGGNDPEMGQYREGKFRVFIRVHS